jgi:hypothetical protein
LNPSRRRVQTVRISQCDMFRCMSVPEVCEPDRHDVLCLLWFGSCLWDCTMYNPQVRSEPKPPFPELKLARSARTPLNLADTGHPPVRRSAPAPGVHQIQAHTGRRSGLVSRHLKPGSSGGFAVSRGDYDDTETKRTDHVCFNRRDAFDILIARRGLRNERQPYFDDHESDGRGGGNFRGATGCSCRSGRIQHTFIVAIDAVDSGSSLCVQARWRSNGDGRSGSLRSINPVLRHID